MKTTEQQEIEQLYYTWSLTGIDSVVTGYRIRAASAGLSNPATERVQKLNAYESYKLPLEADPSIRVESTPVCLSLLSAGNERILVQKVYRGKDDVGRQGAFFAHFLVGLPAPEVFSPLDAIQLWKSRFFQRSESGLNPQSTNLQRVSTLQLKEYVGTLQPSLITQKRAHICFSYFIEAYLTKRLLAPKRTDELLPQPLYIAGSDDDIAYFIYALLHCLPPRLVQNITFSTYEHDFTKASMEIIGTCWLSGPEYERDQQHIPALFPTWYYDKGQKLALNCYTGQHSPLTNNPSLVKFHSDAAEFAQDALTYLEQGWVPSFDFPMLLSQANAYPKLDTFTFLDLYHKVKYLAPVPVPVPVPPLPQVPQGSQDVLFLEKFIRAPFPLQDQYRQVAESLRRVQNNPKSAELKKLPGLVKGLKEAFATCIENSTQLVIVLLTLKSVFWQTDLFEFLRDVARNVQEGVRQKHYPQDRILVYLELTYSLRMVFFEPLLTSEQELTMVQDLQRILLKDMDAATFRWFTEQASGWNELQERWRIYTASPVTETVFHKRSVKQSIARFFDDRQQQAAFVALEKALRKGSIAGIISVLAKHEATLEAHTQEIEPKWLLTTYAAFDFYHAYQDFNDKSIPGDKKAEDAALVEAYRKVCELPEKGGFELRLTNRELQSYEAAQRRLMILQNK